LAAGGCRGAVGLPAASGSKQTPDPWAAIDTSEVYFGVECYGRQASARTKQLLPAGSRVYLFPEPATDRVDNYGRLLRYIVRVLDGLNVNIRLVAVGAAAPYFYGGRRGRYAN
jgi:endonuclease YncB( thermonuclease family)